MLIITSLYNRLTSQISGSFSAWEEKDSQLANNRQFFRKVCYILLCWSLPLTICLLRLRQNPGSRDDGEHIAPDAVLAGELLNQAAADNILAGDREHGLPNNTRADEQPVVNTQDILDHIHQENTNQVKMQFLKICTEFWLFLRQNVVSNVLWLMYSRLSTMVTYLARWQTLQWS